MMKLHYNGVGTGVHYRSIPSHTYYKENLIEKVRFQKFVFNR